MRKNNNKKTEIKKVEHVRTGYLALARQKVQCHKRQMRKAEEKVRRDGNSPVETMMS